jgi:DNA-binding GntR family transcriptional regulator
MNYIVLNKFSKIPLYLQLKESIKQAINDGILKNKDQLPTEESICHVFNVSRPVVRQAYNELIEEGLIQRHQGKGTYVQKNVVYENLIHRLNFDEELRQRGVQPYTRILMIDVVDRSQLPQNADFDPAYNSFYVLKRIRSGDRVPLFYDLSYFPTDVFTSLKEDVAHLTSYTPYLREKLNFDEVRLETSMSVIALDDETAAILEVATGSAAFDFSSAFRDMEGHLLYLRRAYFPGERHHITVSMEERNALY